MLTGTLLVVDNEPHNVDLLRMIVEDFEPSIRFEVAGDGQEAITHERELRPDLLLMDLKMPVLDGWEATRPFQPAARADEITGSGLGLVIGRRLVAAHGGRIGAEDTTTGCCFVCHVPARMDA